MGGAALVAAFAWSQFSTSLAAEVAVKIPAPTADLVTEAPGAQEIAVFAGGCFWGVQGVFQHTKGVISAVSGYAGGSKQTAVYELVGSGMTGHAESVQITFDPKQITYAQLLQIYFSVAHDPTQLNRQFPDSGTQYRSAIFTTSASQKMVADKYIGQLDAAKVFPAKIVTQVGPLSAFYAAEAYHQDYATLHPESGYIAHYDLPKIANLKTTFPQLYRDQPVLVLAKR
jgi:peptide-methionine (S)-S-oxide reductase